jgi:sortase A
MRRRLGSLLVAAGLVLMAWPVVTWAYGLYWQEQLARSLPPPAADVPGTAASPSPAVAPAGPKRAPPRQPKPKKPSLRAGQAVARLRIPRIGLEAIVVEGVDGRALRRGPGHLPGTALPGENRNCAIAAHRDGWFRRLPEVRAGDPIWVETPDSLYKYVVEEKRVVTPDRGDLLKRGEKPHLTLITCTGPGYPRSAYRLLVFCDLRSATPR